jgi:hypothetical protein
MRVGGGGRRPGICPSHLDFWEKICEFWLKKVDQILISNNSN